MFLGRRAFGWQLGILTSGRFGNDCKHCNVSASFRILVFTGETLIEELLPGP